jgi:hypothetical protein
MRTSVLAALSIFVSISTGEAMAQADSLEAQAAEARAHIVHIADMFEQAPGGQGLLRMAVAEAEIAALHADLAAEAVNSLDDVRLHIAHMLHALDPAVVLEGPGLGYGLRRALDEALFHLELAANSPGGSDNLRTHATHIASVLNNTIRRADVMLALAQEIQLTTSTGRVAQLLERLTVESSALGPGMDADRDDLIGWQGGEGGLQQAVWHITLLKRGEGLLAQP